MRRLIFILFSLVFCISAFSQDPIIKLTNRVTNSEFLINAKMINYVLRQPQGSEIVTIDPGLRIRVTEDLEAIDTIPCGGLFLVNTIAGQEYLLNQNYVREVKTLGVNQTHILTQLGRSEIVNRFLVTESLAAIENLVELCDGTGGGTGGDGFWTRDGTTLHPTTITDDIGLNTNMPSAHLTIRAKGLNASMLDLRGTGMNTLVEFDNEVNNGRLRVYESTGAVLADIKIDSIVFNAFVGINESDPDKLLHVSLDELGSLYDNAVFENKDGSDGSGTGFTFKVGQEDRAYITGIKNKMGGNLDIGIRNTDGSLGSGLKLFPEARMQLPGYEAGEFESTGFTGVVTLDDLGFVVRAPIDSFAFVLSGPLYDTLLPLLLDTIDQLDATLFSDVDTLSSNITHELNAAFNFKSTGNFPAEDIFHVSENGVGFGNNLPEVNYVDIRDTYLNGTVDLQVANDATSATSHAGIYLNTEVGAGDPFINFAASSSFSMGLDNSDGDKFKITTGANPSNGNELFKLDLFALDLFTDHLTLSGVSGSLRLGEYGSNVFGGNDSKYILAVDEFGNVQEVDSTNLAGFVSSTIQEGLWTDDGDGTISYDGDITVKDGGADVFNVNTTDRELDLYSESNTFGLRLESFTSNRFGFTEVDENQLTFYFDNMKVGVNTINPAVDFQVVGDLRFDDFGTGAKNFSDDTFMLSVDATGNLQEMSFVEVANEVAENSTFHKNIIYVDPNGSNTTGLKGSVLKPFENLEWSELPIANGDVITVNAGSYTVSSDLTLTSELTIDARHASLYVETDTVFKMSTNSSLKLYVDTLSIDVPGFSGKGRLVHNDGTTKEVMINANVVIDDQAAGNGNLTSADRSKLGVHGEKVNVNINTLNWLSSDFIQGEGTKFMDVDIGEVIVPDKNPTSDVLGKVVHAMGSTGNLNARIGQMQVLETDDTTLGDFSVTGLNGKAAQMYTGQYVSSSVFEKPDQANSYTENLHSSYYSGLITNASVSHIIGNVTGSHLTQVAANANNSKIYHEIGIGSLVNTPVALNRIPGVSTNVVTNGSSIQFNLKNIICDDLILRDGGTTISTNSEVIIEGDKWEVTPINIPVLYVEGTTLSLGSKFIIDVGHVTTQWHGLKFDNVTVGADCELIIRGTFESTGPHPVVTFNNCTNLGRIIFENCTLINDGTVPTIESDINIEVIVKDGYTNSLVVDPEVTEKVSPFTRDASLN